MFIFKKFILLHCFLSISACLFAKQIDKRACWDYIKSEIIRQTGFEDPFVKKSSDTHKDFLGMLVPIMSKTYSENVLSVAVGTDDDALCSRILPQVNFVDNALRLAIQTKNKSKTALLLSKTSLENAILSIDSFENKDFFLYHPKAKHVLLTGLFRSFDYGNFFKNKSASDNTKTSKLFQKYRACNYLKLQKNFGESEYDKLLLPYQPYLENIVYQVAEKEQKAKSQGYTTFVHGRRWEFNFLSDIWNLIRAIKNNDTEISSRPWLRFRDENTCDPVELCNIRQKLVQDGAYCGSAVNRQSIGKELTCVNRTIFSNLNWPYECTGWYVKNNFSCASKNKALELAIELCKENGLSDYISIIQNLFQVHKESGKAGELLCVHMKETEIDTMMYVAQKGGKKHKSTSHSSVLESIKHHQKLIEETYDYVDTATSKNDNNQTEIYCIACIDTPGEYGSKYTIDSIIDVDEVKYQNYKQQLHNLFTTLQLKNKD